LEAVMYRILGVCAVALVCVGLLSSCALLPDADPTKTSDVEMQHIAYNVKYHDAAALEKLFSPLARAKAPNLGGGVEKFLSFFPSGFTSWSDPEGGRSPDAVSHRLGSALEATFRQDWAPDSRTLTGRSADGGEACERLHDSVS
jgi:hypothetical protein